MSMIYISEQEEIHKIISALSLSIPVHSVDPGSVSLFRLDSPKTEWGRYSIVVYIV